MSNFKQFLTTKQIIPIIHKTNNLMFLNHFEEYNNITIERQQ